MHLQKCYNNEIINNKFKKKICFRIFPRKEFFFQYNTLIFFLIKDKKELIFQLMYFLSNMNIKNEIFIIGKNNFGINSLNNIFKEWIILKKIKYKKKCTLYYGRIQKKPIFILKKYLKKYNVFNINIITLPGVFGYKKFDLGSKIMISSFKKKITGKILDIGSGSGILSIFLKKKFKNIKITLIDNNSTALLCSKYNLKINKISGCVYYSNIFSHINEKFNLIISNPPTHYGNYNNLNIIYKIIKKSKKYLYKNGELRIILHSNISCKQIFIKYFGNYKILKKKQHYNIYQTFKKNI
ncbi:methyltransferase domain-containing protein [Buchnera aphidicola (Therioaphis trifolii)]|uniref:Methyltransferase domain-containing protein n=2 Tax=Buchnera aphidicola TaxID=9 RepID=A0A4D6YBC8_9GAMM|nr:methyltransferase domain-containing protein [Buchnera aphidicola (Therioaphis trifolii)]